MKQTVLLTSYPLAKDISRDFLHLKVMSWLDEHDHAMCHMSMYSCPETGTSPRGALPTVSSYAGKAWGKLNPSTHPAADVQLPLLSALYLRAVPQATKPPKLKGLFLLYSSLSIEQLCVWRKSIINCFHCLPREMSVGANFLCCKDC